LIGLPNCLRLSGVHVADERSQADKDKARLKVTGGLLSAMERGTTYGGCLPGGLGSLCYQVQGNKFVAVIDLLEAIEIWSAQNKGAKAMSMWDPCWHWRWRDLQLQSQYMRVTLHIKVTSNLTSDKSSQVTNHYIIHGPTGPLILNHHHHHSSS